MKSLAELNAIKEKILQEKAEKADKGQETKILVGMATCGIMAGAMPVMTALMQEVEKRQLKNVVVSQTGCIGLCNYEPIIEVLVPDMPKVTYINVSPERAIKILNDHVVNGHVIQEFTVDNMRWNKE